MDKSWQTRTRKSSVGVTAPSRSKSLLQRKCACGQSAGSGTECDECKKKELQRKSAGTGGPATAPPLVHEVLSTPGEPLDSATREFFEPRFGHDFSRVRVHTDDRAATSARSVNAAAYTVGKDIVFDSNQYRPLEGRGNPLFAHELAHVVQQEKSAPSLDSDSEDLHLAPPDDGLEHEAETAEKNLGGVSPALHETQMLRRAPKDPGKELERGSTLPYAQATALSDCIAIMGEQSREYCWNQVKNADPRDLHPISPYRRALGDIRSLDPLLFSYLTKAPLNGPSTPVRVINGIDKSQTPPVSVQITFNLQVKEVALAPGLDADFNGGVPVIAGSATSKTVTANMEMQVNTNSSVSLAEALYHEGVHMLLFMDDLVPGGSPHGAGLDNYKKIANAHPDITLLKSQLTAMIEAGLKQQKLDPAKAPARADELLNDVWEEKYVRDQEAAKFNATFTNRALAATQILKDLADLKITPQITDVAFQSIFQAAARIMDSIDQQVKSAQTTSPPAQKPPAQKKP